MSDSQAQPLLVPKSTGALLGEEWSINPLSPFPSFLEMKLIEEAGKSGHSALRTVFALLIQRMRSYGEEAQEATSLGMSQRHGDSSNQKPWQGKVCAAIASFLQRYSPELRYLMIYLIERAFLRTSSSTVAESLYGAKRVVLEHTTDSTANTKKLVPLGGKQGTRLALLLTLLPYLNEKLEQFQSSHAARRHRRLTVLLLLLRSSLEGTNLLCQWRFLIGRSVFFDLPSFCLNQLVRRVTQQDRELTSSVISSSSPLSLSPASLELPTTTSSGKGQRLLLTLLSAAVTASVLTQVRAMWEERTGSQEDQTLPPPPHAAFGATPVGRTVVSNSSSCCPLCRRPWVEPTAAPSGVVFCRACLSAYLSDNANNQPRCPVTGVDCPQMVRLYEPHQLPQ